MLRLVQSRRIEQGNLRTWCMHDPENSCSRRLRLVGNDRNLLFKQSIEQCRFADVWSSNDRDSAELHAVTDVAAPVMARESIDRRFHLCGHNPVALAPT